MKLNYKQKLFLYITLIFVLFSIGIVLFEQSRERQQKTAMLEEKLDAYANVVDKYLQQHRPIDSLLSSLPANVRLTLVDKQGAVLYDNAIKEPAVLENHAQRPEVLEAKASGRGSEVRISTTNHQEYLYYAKQFPKYYVRVALPYDVDLRDSLKAGNVFIYFMLLLFVAMLFLINYVAGRFGKSINQLRDFTLAAGSGQPLPAIDFPDDELGEIGTKIAGNYRQLKQQQKEIFLEREKLLQHVYSSEEGLCFFSAKRAVEFYNGLFIQYLNTIIDEANSEPLLVLTDAAFEKLHAFLATRRDDENYFETKINKQGKYFAVRANIFEDNGFEIIINDITEQEKTRLLKQEMTGNIAHELRTPVTSIRGSLETILEQNPDAEKTRQFLTKAHHQTIILSELIQDMSLITKMEECPQAFPVEPVAIASLLEELRNDLEMPLQQKDITMEWKSLDNVVVNGNRHLLYSVFRNLCDNTIRYAGNNVRIAVNKYNEDNDFYYFSFADNGVGISDKSHLNRLFERFYRITEGRTRDTGGSGLGLSIVKNAVAFHKGSIVAKNKLGGGLEFLFTLKKK